MSRGAANEFPIHPNSNDYTYRAAQAMWKEIDRLRARVYELETPEREKAEMMAWLRKMFDDACKKDCHPVTHRVNGRSVCTRCGFDMTERLRWEID